MNMNNRSGHTITEIMVSSTIFLFMMAGMYTALHAGNVSWAIQDVRVDIQEQARRAMSTLTQDLRVAQGLTINEVIVNGELTIDVTFTRAGETIRYDWTEVNGAPTENQLIRTDDDGAVITARDIVSLSFIETATDVKIDLTTSAQSSLQQNENFSLVGNVALR